MTGKLGGIYAPKVSAGPHKCRECLPMVIIVRNRMKYALTRTEAQAICMQKLVRPRQRLFLLTPRSLRQRHSIARDSALPPSGPLAFGGRFWSGGSRGAGQWAELVGTCGS